MDSVGLVLEGGGMRGVYTAGILENWLEQGLFFPYVIGVSAGACNAASYISRQAGRNKRVTIGYIDHPRYLGFRNMLRERSFFGMNFIFDEIPNRLVPFDYDAFYQSEQRFVVGATDCLTGDPVYFEKSPEHDMMTVVRASSSLPFMAPIICYGGYALLDGGIADPIPVRRSIADGNERHIVILTRPEGYVKGASGMRWLTRQLYRQYPGIVRAMELRHERYNDTMALVNEWEKEGRAFVFRPPAHLPISRVERKRERLEAFYEQGYREAAERAEELMKWLEQK